MDVIVKRDTPHKAKAIASIACFNELFFYKLARNVSGCTTMPTRKSETAKLQSRVKDGERSEGVLNMKINTKRFPIVDMSINGAFRTQLMMITVSRQT